jgi:hypothetical protein
MRASVCSKSSIPLLQIAARSSARVAQSAPLGDEIPLLVVSRPVKSDSIQSTTAVFIIFCFRIILCSGLSQEFRNGAK